MTPQSHQRRPPRLHEPHLHTVLLAYMMPSSLIVLMLLTSPIPLIGSLLRRYWFWMIHFYAASIQLTIAGMLRTRDKRHGLGQNEEYQVAWRATLLGHGFALGLATFLFTPSGDTTWMCGLYLMELSLFHVGEFVTALYQRSSLSVESFLLYHSNEYIAAMMVSLAEFWITQWLLGGLALKSYFTWISALGPVLCLTGDALRKAAMVTAGESFSHVIRDKWDSRQRLVTHGVYALIRHPSYVGWFLWCLGTQVTLLNPMSLVVFYSAAHRFFNDRIVFEERTLVDQFGAEYLAYQRRVPWTGIPGVVGSMASSGDGYANNGNVGNVVQNPLNPLLYYRAS